jgi:hypothetical protein
MPRPRKRGAARSMPIKLLSGTGYPGRFWYRGRFIDNKADEAVISVSFSHKARLSGVTMPRFTGTVWHPESSS